MSSKKYRHLSDHYPPLAFSFPCIAAQEERERARRQRIRSLEIDHWDADRPRAKALFGSGRVELSIAQARKAKLVKEHPLYRQYVYRVFETGGEEDKLLLPFLEKKRQADTRRKAREEAKKI